MFGGVFRVVKAFIPQHVKNRTVLRALCLMSGRGGKIPEKRITENARENKRRLSGSTIYLRNRIFIENQPEWSSILFGAGRRSNMAYSGCEIIAVYNALAALGEKVSPDMMTGLISSFERRGAVLRGDFGVSPAAIYDYFSKRGYSVFKSDSKDAALIDEIGRKCTVSIVTLYNDDRDITAQIHTICVTKDSGGAYVLHNAYHREGGEWRQRKTGERSLTAAVSADGKKRGVICVIGVTVQPSDSCREWDISSNTGTLSLLSARSGSKLENTSLRTGGFIAPAYGRYIPLPMKDVKG